MDAFSFHGDTAHGWVQHNLPWLVILALLFSLFETVVTGADGDDMTMGEDG